MKRTTDSPFKPDTVERSIQAAITELWAEPPKLRKSDRIIEIRFPQLGKEPPYHLFLILSPQEEGTKILYWQKRASRMQDWAIAIFASAAIAAIFLFQTKSEHLFIIAVPIAFMAHLLMMIGPQPRTKQLIRYSTNERK